MATNAQRLRQQIAFGTFLANIGIPQGHFNVLLSEGFENFNSVMETYREEGPEELKKLMMQHNKLVDARPAAGRGPRVRFNQLMIKRLTGTLDYVMDCVYIMHACPNILLVNQARADELGAAYYEKRASRNAEGDNDDTIDTKLPIFKGTNNWSDYRDRFLFKLACITNAKGYALEYVVDETERDVLRATANLIEGNSPIIDTDTIKTQAVHFGSQYRKDNSKVWSILKSSLMNTTQFNHIAPYAPTKNGREAWLALNNYYQG